MNNISFKKSVLDEQLKELNESQNKKRVWFVLDPDGKLAIIISSQIGEALGNPSVPAIFFREIDALNFKKQCETQNQSEKFRIKEVYY